MIDNRTASAIDLALQKHHTPVGDLYAAIRHGRMKRCFSRGYRHQLAGPLSDVAYLRFVRV
ncbi:Uncharacterised protein [Klebsiella pneumoniae]|uniref:Uncharacterized protein n=1 Tax=Klebsiella pneumoniae TaxID=573 RepID=A0A377TH81_KLEPN|nr:Uncharacterised protein [Klebsiella pneumoniae]